MTINEKILDTLNKYTGRLKDFLLTYNDVVNNCTTNDSSVPLSAAQGKYLQDQITLTQNQMRGVSFLSKSIESGETVVFDIPLLTKAIAIVNVQANGQNAFLYIDSQQELVYVGNMLYASATSRVSFINDKECITIINNNSKGMNIFFLIFNGSISIRE